jgi:SAM-dependent methyltransferase
MGYEYTYDSGFFDFVSASSAKSARVFLDRFLDVVLGGTIPASVLDVGCGRGVWPADWLRRGATTVVGVDGTYVDAGSLLMPRYCFVAANLSDPLDLRQRFDLVECLEVAEHVQAACADTLIDTLVRHSDLVLFSAAVPGQGGEFHVNEQPHEYWRSKFAARGYRPYDAVRPAVVKYSDIEPWYRYNSFVYANDAGASRLTGAARAAVVPDATRLADVSPLWWKLRCRAIATLPAALTNRLARLKHHAANLVR